MGPGKIVEPASPEELQPAAKTFEEAIEVLVTLVDSTPGIGNTREGSMVKTKLQEAKHWWLAGKGVL
jgi:hypothetical protein